MVIYSLFAGAILLLFSTLSTAAQALTPTKAADDLPSSTCSLIDRTARLNALPVDFFARLLWQESRFQPDIVGPLTRGGGRAEGIAQFMPGTAFERGLINPFDPVEAVPKSAEFLADLRDQFGNLGLAAAAYNAGPQRLRDFLAGSRDLPSETRHYVIAVTAHPIEDWVKQTKIGEGARVRETDGSQDTAPTCRDVVALLERPIPSAAREDRTIPSWCHGLHHPNVSLCGQVRLNAPSIESASLAVSQIHIRFRGLTR